MPTNSRLRPLPRRTRGARLVLLLLAPFLMLSVSACGEQQKWHNTDITGNLPALDFSMTRVNDGKPVTAANYRGKVTLLFFGYTSCPDVCPMTLANIGQVMKRLGAEAGDIRTLFVSVDPDRDTPSALGQYVASFGFPVDGLRGDANALAALARRYRVAYSVRPSVTGHDYEVSHSSGIYVFDRNGTPRLLVSSLSMQNPDLDGVAADLQRIVESK